MKLLRTSFLCLCACAVTVFLAGCGFNNRPSSNSGGGSGSASGSGASNSAYVYVASAAASARSGQIFGFLAAADGSLTALTGSPYPAPGISSLAATDSNVFATVSGLDIQSYSIGPNGAIALAATTNAEQNDSPPTEGGPVSVFLDKDGQTVYTNEAYGFQGNSAYQAYSIQPAGRLSFLGMSTNDDPQDQHLSFTGNDQYAYGSDCHMFSPNIYGYVRNASGELTDLNTNANLPTPPSGIGYCPEGAAVAGNQPYLVIALQGSASPYEAGSWQLALYSIQGDGTLTTTSTPANMPTTAVGQIYDYRFDPTGNYLAVAGALGVQLYALRNGALAQVSFLALRQAITQVGWDAVGHLYAISGPAGVLLPIQVMDGGSSLQVGNPVSLPPYLNGLAIAPLP